MTAIRQTSEFVDRARRLGALPESPLRADLPEHPADAAETLVADGVLTRFQADTLLADPSKLRYGPYLLLSPLGEGGMGKVYLARHLDLGRLVALKVLLGTPADSLARERFRREARAVAALDHPNVVRLYEIGREGEAEYLVMELVEGIDLCQRLREGGPLAHPVAAGLVRQAAVGLAHAHERGIVHRDIKPANLMLTPDGVVKILDLGLARSVSDPADALTSPGLESGISGTVDYLSPEQAVNGPVDRRADVYGLGCTLVALVTGGPPYTGTVAQKLLQHQNAPPPDLHRETGGRVPREFADLVARMMAKRPQDRPASAAEVIRLLAPWVGEAESGFTTDVTDGFPTFSDCPNSPTIRLPAGLSADTVQVPPPPARRTRRARWAVAAALAGVGVLLAFGLRGMVRAEAGVAAPQAATAPTGEVVYETDFRDFAAFEKHLDAEAVLTPHECPTEIPVGWMLQNRNGGGRCRFAAAAGQTGKTLSVAATDKAAGQCVFMPTARPDTPLEPNTRYLATWEYSGGPAEFDVLERDIWAVLTRATTAASERWRTVEVAFVAPPARGVQFAVAPAVADGTPVRVRRFRLERLANPIPAGKPLYALDPSGFPSGVTPATHSDQARTRNQPLIPDGWWLDTYVPDGVVELASVPDADHPHLALRNRTGMGAQLFQSRPSCVLRGRIPHRVTIKYRATAGTAAGFDIRSGDVQNWQDPPFTTRLPATGGMFETRHYDFVPPADVAAVVVFQNHSDHAGNEFAVRRFSITPLR